MCIVSFAGFLGRFDDLTATFHDMFPSLVFLDCSSVSTLIGAVGAQRNLELTEHQHHTEIDQTQRHIYEYRVPAIQNGVLQPKVQLVSNVRLICRAKSTFGTSIRACGPQSSSFLVAPGCACVEKGVQRCSSCCVFFHLGKGYQCSPPNRFRNISCRSFTDPGGAGANHYIQSLICHFNRYV